MRNLDAGLLRGLDQVHPFRGRRPLLPSIVNLITLSGMLMLLRSVAVLARLLKLAAVFRDEGFHGPRGGFAERADRLAVDVVGNACYRTSGETLPKAMLRRLARKHARRRSEGNNQAAVRWA